MLGASPFYYRLMRRYVVLFGALFDDITILRKDTTNSEVSRFKVPIIYGPKEHWMTRLTSDPDTFRELNAILPRISYEMTGIGRDSQRAQNPLLRISKGDLPTRTSSMYMGTPYNMDFDLNIYARTIDDANQIVEQIFPYFNPTYTVSITPVDELAFLKDIPITLNNVSQDVSYEGAREATRFVYWTFNFTMKGYFFGPILNPKIIRKSIVNIFNDPSLITGYVIRMKLNQGNNGTFQISDTIYQGSNFDTATAYGTVLSWDSTNRKLMIGGAQGQFTANSTIRAVTSNSAYQITSFDSTPIKLSEITIEPDPITAQPGDDYGYTTVIKNFPDTEIP